MGATPTHAPALLGAEIQANEGGALDALAERVALRVVELLGEHGGAPLLDAADVARQLGRSREWVYRHADDLAAVRLGDGARPRLGFERVKVAEYLRACESDWRSQPVEEPTPKPNQTRRRKVANGQGRDLLPIRGEAPCR